MKYQANLQTFLALILAGSLASCGGGGSGGSAGTTGGTTSSVGVQTPTVAQGMVSGFGSVIVNGVHYDVKDAAIEIDGEAKTELDLDAGQQVHVVGSVDADGKKGKATKLIAESQLIGGISAIDTTAGTLTVLDQTVLVTGDTFFKVGVSLSTLKVADVIAVGGFLNDQGQLVATYINIKTNIAVDAMQLTGVVANLDTTAKTFTINTKTVDYTNAILTNLPSGALANGQRVRVHGKITNGVFVATGAIRLSNMDINHDTEVTKDLVLEVGGIATNVVANTSFSLGDLAVLVDTSTRYLEGTAADLINGAKIKVHGKLNADRKLVAESVKFFVNPQVDETGKITAIDLTNSTFTVNNIVFQVNADTSTKDEGKSLVRLFSLSSLVTGDTVRVRGYKVLGSTANSTTFVATQVKRLDAEKPENSALKIEVTATVDAVNGNVITLLNHQVELNANTKIEGFATLADFLANAVGSKVEVEAFMDGGRLLASKVTRVAPHSESGHSSSSTSSEVHSSSSRSSEVNSSSSVSSAASSLSSSSASVI